MCSAEKSICSCLQILWHLERQCIGPNSGPVQASVHVDCDSGCNQSTVSFTKDYRKEMRNHALVDKSVVRFFSGPI